MVTVTPFTGFVERVGIFIVANSATLVIVRETVESMKFPARSIARSEIWYTLKGAAASCGFSKSLAEIVSMPVKVSKVKNVESSPAFGLQVETIGRKPSHFLFIFHLIFPLRKRGEPYQE